MIIQRSETTKAIGAALCKAQAAMHAVKKDATNLAFKRPDAKPSTYATLASVLETVRGPLTENGIMFMQAPGAMSEVGFLPIETMFLHGESGEWISFTFPIPITKRDPQGFGSATTYGCRYAMMAALGLAPVDDDGNAASGNGARPLAIKVRSGATDAFGLDDPPSEVEADASRLRYMDECRERITNKVHTEAEIRDWWANQAQARRDFGLTRLDVDLLKSLMAERFKPMKVAAQ